MAKFLLLINLFLVLIITISAYDVRVVNNKEEFNYLNNTEESVYIPANCGLHDLFVGREGRFDLDHHYHSKHRNRHSCKNNDKARDRIAGGNNLKVGQFPSFARLKIFSDDRLKICGATVISKEFLLTSAQCVVNITEEGDYRHYEDIVVRTGSVLRDHQYNGRALKVCYPSSYNAAKPSEDDLAIIKLDKPIKFDSSKQFACLPTDKLDPKEGLYALGMGKNENGRLNNKLKYLPVKQGTCPEYKYDETLCLEEAVTPDGGAVCNGKYYTCFINKVNN